MCAIQRIFVLRVNIRRVGFLPVWISGKFHSMRYFFRFLCFGFLPLHLPKSTRPLSLYVCSPFFSGSWTFIRTSLLAYEFVSTWKPLSLKWRWFSVSMTSPPDKWNENCAQQSVFWPLTPQTVRPDAIDRVKEWHGKQLAFRKMCFVSAMSCDFHKKHFRFDAFSYIICEYVANCAFYICV